MANDPLNNSPAGETHPSHPHNQATAPPTSRPADSRWQRRLLPFLVATLGVLTVLFCAAIAVETHYIQARMESPLQLDLRPAIDQQFRANPNFLLEADLIERRYRAADAAALSRIYLMFLGFGTGMVMALVGATFILAKFSEPATSIDGSGSSFKASLHSGSPGVILAFLGTVLMLSTIFSKTEISLTDRAIYMGGGAEQRSLPQPDAQPAIPENSKTKSHPDDAQKSAPATLMAKNENPPPDEHLEYAPPRTLDGEYTLKAHAGTGRLSIRDKTVQFTRDDGKKSQVNVLFLDHSHAHFTVVEPDGGRQDFDGFRVDSGDIVGSTSYQGSFSTNPIGFTATRIKQK
jgi:hypothetical protein